MSRRRRVDGLTRQQKRALALLEAAGPGVVTSARTTLMDGRPWVHWRTAHALHDRGLARVTGEGDDAEIVLS